MQVPKWITVVFAIIWFFLARSASAEVVSLFVDGEFQGAPRIWVELSERVNKHELERIARDINADYEDAFLRFYLSNNSSADLTKPPTWAIAEFNAEGAADLTIFGFTKDEWELFAKDGGMHPPDADLLGIWEVINPSLSGRAAQIFNFTTAIYRWRGKTFVYAKQRSGFGTPKEFYEQIDSHKRVVLLPVLESYDYWVITRNGDLQVWDGEGHIKEYYSIKLR